MNVVNLIDSVEKVNIGIWSAALINSGSLMDLGVNSFALVRNAEDFYYEGVKTISYRSYIGIGKIFVDNGFTADNTIIISHGCWRWPTIVANFFLRKGYKWIAVPQGMLEVWPMRQKRFKKYVYYTFFERVMLRNASMIRAVSNPEYIRLKNSFGEKVVHIPNSVEIIDSDSETLDDSVLRFLFMARLNEKKGLLPLVKGWSKSKMSNDPKYSLTIAGPDDGELSNLVQIISENSNITYVGAVYGEDKRALLNSCQVYVLPSFSEGFPSSVLEAMSYGLLPLISEGCNFPEVFHHGIAVKIEPTIDDIVHVLNNISLLQMSQVKKRGKAASNFVSENYLEGKIALRLYELYNSLIIN